MELIINNEKKEMTTAEVQAYIIKIEDALKVTTENRNYYCKAQNDTYAELQKCRRIMKALADVCIEMTTPQTDKLQTI